MSTTSLTHRSGPSPAPRVTIRRATPADAETVQMMVLEIAEHEGDSAHVHVTAERWRTLLDREDVVVLLGERDGAPLGYVSAVRRLHLWSGGDLLAVDDVYVRAGARGHGLGRELLMTMARVADTDGLLLTWGVEPENTGAQRFYRRLGATLRPKVVAGWAPAAYRPLLGADSQETR